MSDQTTDKLAQLLALCSNSVHVTVNEHRDYYEDVETFLRHSAGCLDEWSLTPEDVRLRMVATNTVVHVRAYPDNAIGFYSVYDADLDTALTRVIGAIEEERR